MLPAGVRLHWLDFATQGRRNVKERVARSLDHDGRDTGG
jgi:hypothetical protein